MDSNSLLKLDQRLQKSHNKLSMTGVNKIIYLTLAGISDVHSSVETDNSQQALKYRMNDLFRVIRKVHEKFPMTLDFKTKPLNVPFFISNNTITLDEEVASYSNVEALLKAIKKATEKVDMIIKPMKLKERSYDSASLINHFDKQFMTLLNQKRYLNIDAKDLKSMNLFNSVKILDLDNKIFQNSEFKGIQIENIYDLYIVKNWNLFFRADPGKAIEAFERVLQKLTDESNGTKMSKFQELTKDSIHPILIFDYIQHKTVNERESLNLFKKLEVYFSSNPYAFDLCSLPQIENALSWLSKVDPTQIPSSLLSPFLQFFDLHKSKTVNTQYLFEKLNVRTYYEQKSLNLKVESTREYVRPKLISGAKSDHFGFDSVENSKKTLLWLIKATGDNINDVWKIIEEGSPSKIQSYNIVMAYESHLKDQFGLLIEYSRTYNLRSMMDYFMNVKTYEDLSFLDFEKKYNFVEMLFRSQPPSDVKDRLFFDLLQEAKNKGMRLDRFCSPVWIHGLFFDSYKVDVALWQLSSNYQLDNLASDLKSRKQSLPRKNFIRKNIPEILNFIDRQFPSWSMAKERLLDELEIKLITSQAETRMILDHRGNASNWSTAEAVALFALPSDIKEKISSPDDVFQIIEFLVDARKFYPSLVERFEKIHRKQIKENVYQSEQWKEKELESLKISVKVLKIAMDKLKQLFATQSTPVQATIIAQFVNFKGYELLPVEHFKNQLFRLMLGSHADNWIVSELVKAYMDSAPKEQYTHLLSYLVASQGKSNLNSKTSIRPIFEAMGAFGIKAGQFLYSSGLLGAEMAKDLEDFLSAAAPPSRYEVTHYLEKAFGKELRNIEVIGEVVGSGSINFVVRVDFMVNGKIQEAVVRIRRPFLEGLNENENEIWAKVHQQLLVRSEGMDINSNQRAELLSAANIINESRSQSYETLKQGGPELDLSIERTVESLAKVYNYSINDGELKGWRVRPIEHLPNLQRLVSPEMQTMISVYPRVNSTPLKEIGDLKLRKELAKQILRAELRAVFEVGTFDQDGHQGNWLIDLAKKEIIRIDYSQITTITKTQRTDFSRFLFEIMNEKPNFNDSSHRKLLLRLFDFPEGISLNEKDLANLSFNISSGKQTPLKPIFEIRSLLTKYVSEKYHREIELQYRPEIRSSLASISKLRKLGDFMTTSEFQLELAKYISGLSVAKYVAKGITLTERIKERVTSIFSDRKKPTSTELISEKLNGEKIQVTLSHKEEGTFIDKVPESPILEGDIVVKGSGKTTVSDQDKISIYSDHVELDLTWAEKAFSTSNIIPITEKQFKLLPQGTKLYQRFTSGNKTPAVAMVGFSGHPIEEYSGLMTFGVLRSDYEKYGGPERSPVVGFNQLKALVNVTKNRTLTTRNGTEIVLITQEQFNLLPENTYLVDTAGQPFVKIRGMKQPRIFDFDKRYISVGFPSSKQVGFEYVGVDFKTLGVGFRNACDVFYRGH